MKKIILLAVVFLFLPMRVQADRPLLDAVLVIDVSNSMRGSDPNRLAQEAMKLFIDMLGTNNDRVGIVAYAGEVKAYLPLTLLDSPAAQATLRDFIDNLYYAGWTDHSTGITKAIQLLFDTENEANNTPLLLLLTDGNTVISPNSPRTYAQAREKLQAKVYYAANTLLPIYTIGLNHDGTLNRFYIEHIAAATNARAFETTGPEALPGIITEILTQRLLLTPADEHQLTADGEKQWVTVSVPPGYVQEAHILVFSMLPLAEITLINPYGEETQWNERVSLSQSSAYSLIILTEPTPGDWRLGKRGIDGDNVWVRVFLSEAIQAEPVIPTLAPPPEDIPPEDTPSEDATFENITNEIFYPEEETAALFPWPGLAIIAAALFALSIFLRLRKKNRVFTGRLTIEANHHTPQHINLIQYGKRTTLNTLLNTHALPQLSNIILTPAPTTPAHRPQLLLTCKNPHLTFRKDFTEIGAKKGLIINPGEKLYIHLPEPASVIKLDYAA